MAESVPPFAEALQSLERESGYFALTRAAQSIYTLPPPPLPPADCAEGYCLPIIDPADMAARDWIRGLYEAVAVSVSDKQPSSVTTAETFVQEHGGSLRRAEVEFLGEAALMDVVADRPEWLNRLWSCQQLRHGCEVPLLSVQDWFSN